MSNEAALIGTFDQNHADAKNALNELVSLHAAHLTAHGAGHGHSKTFLVLEGYSTDALCALAVMALDALVQAGGQPGVAELEQLCVKLNQYGAPGHLTDGLLIPFLGKWTWMLLRSTANGRVVSFAVEVSPDRCTTVAYDRETNIWAVAR